MAQKVITVITDDLTGEEIEDAKTHTFSVNGSTYEIDLGSDSYDSFLEAVRPFMEAGRRVKKARGGAPRGKADAGAGGDTAAIRLWAKENGYEVNERGRIPAEIREAYENAH
ncbi:histone-like nucleoid-structuring protein Lsr2 [Streptomyces purpurogeneiscleroticus]|uniref:histone-like nucleoid-structuring protein Lsr2 n=1 Tax=Streptomyces purpurogeneiscleroticus TaxID=68259 RepID=UPI001CBC39A7|nr:Lsr2 family protein [Streptomyces purpurogeneiscleroticus]MBZ4016260.1 hypothetical protein [Streptomyces purpurogeneiscleroticus]